MTSTPSDCDPERLQASLDKKESTMQIHLYLPDVERYRQLALVDERHWAPLNERFDGSSMIDAWEPVDVEPLHAKRPVSDFPALGNLPVLSTRAAEALQDLLDGCGEL